MPPIRDGDEAIERHGGQYVARDGRAEALGKVSALDEEAEEAEALEALDHERVGAEVGAHRRHEHDRVEHDEHAKVHVEDGRSELGAREDHQRAGVAQQPDQDHSGVQIGDHVELTCICD